jgi:sugar (pentulose or hexulose) kinase
MIHVNNFTPEINAWVDLLAEGIALGGGSIDKGELFDRLYECARGADADLGGLVAYNFRAGEPIAGAVSGAPLVARGREGRLTLANLMKTQIYSALGSLALGMRILREEQVKLDTVCGHGGFFKSGAVAQSAMSAAIGAPVSVMETAGEGGAWGVALLGLMVALGRKDADAFLEEIFQNAKRITVEADEAERQSFGDFMTRYSLLLPVELASAERLNS